MDVLFYTPGGRSFSIEVYFFDTVLDIKEKIQTYQNIPISKQALIFNAQLLQDDGDIWTYEIFKNSHIELIIAQDSKVQLNIKVLSSGMHFPLEMDMNETVLKMKQKIHEIDSDVPINKIILQVKGTELQDNQFLRDCDVLNNNEIEISLRQPIIGVGGSNTIIVRVLSECRTRNIFVEVNPSDIVGELRKKLQVFHHIIQFRLPKEGSFFIHKNNIMSENRSFHWHSVAHGDTIYISNGRRLTK